MAASNGSKQTPRVRGTSLYLSGSGWTFTPHNTVVPANEKLDRIQASKIACAPGHGPSATTCANGQQGAETKMDFDAAIFDMDGVLTQTAAVHSLAWKRMFDEYLRFRETKYNEPFREFTHGGDYLKYVDGRPRNRGVESFLQSRRIVLPFGTPEDGEGSESVCGLGIRKNALFNRIIENVGVGLYDSTVVLIRAMQHHGIKVGLATSSKNSVVILNKTGTAHLFATIVDGIVSEKLGLKGKPAPDIFVTASANLGVPCARAIVVEDAVSGVEAGAKGGFGLVIGVARDDNAKELGEHGADLVVRDLGETGVDKINGFVRAKRAGAGGANPTR